MKKLSLIIEKCSQCPYCLYDPNYGISYNSGYDCNQNGRRIIDDHKSSIEDYYIPDWCPLEDVGRKEKLEKIISKINEK